METITQLEAARLGLNRYYSGNPCSRGHVTERYVANGVCVECHRERARERKRQLKEIRRQAKEGEPNV